MIKEFYSFKNKEYHYLYNVSEMLAFKINGELFKDLNEISNNHFEISDELKDALLVMKLVKNDNESGYLERQEDPSNYTITNLILNLVQDCNLACIYCYGGEGEYNNKGYMSEKIAFDSVDWFLKQAKTAKDLLITFFGGEPLLNFDLLKKIVQYSIEKSKEYEKKLSFSITTNATLISKEVIEFFNQHKFSLTISIDGTEHMHDKNRPFKSGKGSYSSIVPKIKELIESRSSKSICARATVTSFNTDIHELKESLYRIGFKKVVTTPVSSPISQSFTKNKEYLESDSSISEFQLSAEQYEILYSNIEIEGKEILEAIKSRDIVKCSHNRIFETIKQLKTKRKRTTPCGSGRGMIAVSVTGELFPCHRFVGDEKHNLNNIYSFDPLKRRPYFANTVDNKLDCYTCWARYSCGGGCLHDNQHSTGHYSLPNEWSCKFFSKIAESAIVAYCEMNDDDRKFICTEIEREIYIIKNKSNK